MGRSGDDVVGALAAATHQWMQCAMFITNCYAALIDPRPDLGMPARAVKVPYLWWW